MTTGPKPMDDNTFQSVIRARVDDAVAYCGSDLARDNERAIKFYKGDVSDVLPSVDGRSKVVSRDLRDTILAVMPSMVRIFLSREKAVEFEPVGPEDEQWAAQATDYANHIIFKDNSGFTTLYGAMKEAMKSRLGVVKVWWDESTKVSAERFERQDDLTFQAHSMDGEIIEHEEVEGGVDPQTGQPIVLHSYTVKRTSKTGKVCIEGVPFEEFVIARDARSFDRPSIIGHKRHVKVGDLVAMGYDFDEMLELSTSSPDESLDEAKAARSPDEWGDDDEGAGDPASRDVLYGEFYTFVDADGDGILEMRKVCTAGDAYKVVLQEIVDDHPFAIWCPELEPHSAIGLSFYDCLDDIQVIRSQLLRLALDGLSQVVTPRLQVDPQGGVDLKALLENRIGGVVMGRTGAINPITTDKAAPQAAMEAYRLMGEVRQERTGQNQASMGLEADALQSTSRIAANALVQSAQSRVEMIARIYAETGFRRLMRLILRLTHRYQDRERVIRLRNKWVPMNPQQWNPDMDVSVNVGLGNGNPEERAVFLQGFLQIQQSVMQQMGPVNPLVNFDKIRNTLEDLCEVGGRMPDRYRISAEEWAQIQQQMAMQPPQPPKPDPAMLLAEAENKKADAALVKAQSGGMTELLKDDRERDEYEAKYVIDALKAGINPEAVLNIIRMARQATPSIVTGG